MNKHNENDNGERSGLVKSHGGYEMYSKESTTNLYLHKFLNFNIHNK